MRGEKETRLGSAPPTILQPGRRRSRRRLVWSGLVVTEAPPPNRSTHLGQQVDRTPRGKVQKDTGPQEGGGG